MASSVEGQHRRCGHARAGLRLCARLFDQKVGRGHRLGRHDDVAGHRVAGALRELHVRQNQLTSLPASVNKLPALEGLFLQENRLTELPDLSNCTALRGINANQNKLVGLPMGLCKCTAMASTLGVKLAWHSQDDCRT